MIFYNNIKSTLVLELIFKKVNIDLFRNRIITN